MDQQYIILNYNILWNFLLCFYFNIFWMFRLCNLNNHWCQLMPQHWILKKKLCKTNFGMKGKVVEFYIYIYSMVNDRVLWFDPKIMCPHADRIPIKEDLSCEAKEASQNRIHIKASENFVFQGKRTYFIIFRSLTLWRTFCCASSYYAVYFHSKVCAKPFLYI